MRKSIARSLCIENVQSIELTAVWCWWCDHFSLLSAYCCCCGTSICLSSLSPVIHSARQFFGHVFDYLDALRVFFLVLFSSQHFLNHPLPLCVQRGKRELYKRAKTKGTVSRQRVSIGCRLRVITSSSLSLSLFPFLLLPIYFQQPILHLNLSFSCFSHSLFFVLLFV